MNKKLGAQTVPGIDLQQVLKEFENALAIVITVNHALRGSIHGLTSVAPEVITLGQGVKALRAVYER